MIDKKELIIALSMVLASAALAQDAGQPAQTPADPKAPAQKPAAKDAKTDNKAETPAKPEKNLPFVSVGWADWAFNGNLHKFTQYATPPHGFFLTQLRYEPQTADVKHVGLLDLRTPGQDDYRATGRVQLFNGTFNGELSDTRSRFFNTTPQVINQSEREITEGYIKQMLGNNFALTFRNRFEKEDYYAQAPIDPENQRTRYWDVSARGSVGSRGFLDVGFSDFRYWDRTQVMPDSDTRRISASYRHDVSDNLSLEGSYAHATIDQDGFAPSKFESWTVGGRWQPTDSTRVLANFRQDKIDLPNTLNAHDRGRTYWDARIVQALHGDWNVQLGYNQVDNERYRGDLTYVDVPRIHTYDAKVTGNLTPAFRLTSKVMRQTLDGQAVMVDINNKVTAYFRNRFNAQIKLDTTGEIVNAYLVYNWNENQNDLRGVRIGEQTITVGGSIQAKPNLDFYVELANDRWSAKTDNTRSADIGDYFPDGTTWTVGGNWTVNPKLSLSAGYTGLMTRNSNPYLLPDGNVHGNFFNGTVTYRDPRGWNVVLSVAPTTYRDRAYNLMDYSSGFITVSANTKF